MGFLSKIFSGKPKITPIHVETAEEFQREVLDSDLPVILNVWSPTCAPCRKMAPELVATASRYPGRVKVAEISTMADMSILRKLKVRSTPTTMVFDEGQELARVSGFRPRNWFSEMIESEFPA